MTNKEQARQQIQDLVQQFLAIPEKERAKLNESEIQRVFVLPLFRALGWNIENYREVTSEEQILHGYVDFGFYLSGIPAFYVETKKIPANLNKTRWVQQAINYAWLKGVTWAVLTDFDRLKVFNADWRELPFQANFLDLHYTEYVEKFDLLWLLSKESMQQHAMDAFAETVGAKRRRLKPNVRDALFSQMTEWRKDLFRELRAFNGNYTQDLRVIDDAVQKLLDRLIFIRTIEDRGLEQHRLQSLLRQYEEQKGTKKNLYRQIVALFREFDKVYNARLFAEHPLDHLEINDVVLLKRILKGLYIVEGGYAEYDFKAIDADILGAIYEQYLSFKAQDPEGVQYIDLQKLTKRKSQGIYYTPQFIVRYIVEETIGTFLQEGVDPYTLRILDPSCGSGSFLIEAFDVLDRHLAIHGLPEHQNNPRERGLAILENNLFGVDLDPQAVEVARLNLALRIATERKKLSMLNHIQVGNSLVESEFQWQAAFPEVMKQGGFDIIIGNPPYIRQETLGADFKAYAKSHFQSYMGTADLYVYFMEKAHQLLRPKGRFAMITSNKFMRSNYGKNLRQFLAEKTSLSSIVDFGELPVFREAATFPAITVTQNQPSNQQNFTYTTVKDLKFEELKDVVKEKGISLTQRALQGGNWSLSGNFQLDTLEKIQQSGIKLAEYIDSKIYRGVVTGSNPIFIIGETLRKNLITEDPRSAEIIKPIVMGDDIRKYRIHFNNKYLIFTRRGIQIEQYPAVQAYLAQYKDKLMPKPADWQGTYWQGRKSGLYEWYEIQDTIDYYAAFEKPKIVYPDIAKESRVALDTDGLFLANTIYFIPSDDLYLLAVLNSDLIFNYYKRKASVLGDADKGGRLRWFTQDVEQLPILKLDLTNLSDKKKYDHLVGLVKQMLALKKEYAEKTILFEDYDLAYKIGQLDIELNEAIYKIYDLTPSEIEVLKGN